jgi:pectate lyase
MNFIPACSELMETYRMKIPLWRVLRCSFSFAFWLCLACPEPHATAAGASGYLRNSPAWFKSDEGGQVVSNVLSWQSLHGSWPKNMDTGRANNTQDRSKISGTFDNGATLAELRLLARAYNATGTAQCKAAFLLGLSHILEAQYPNGGWPQSFPPGKGYARHITFNDNTMVALVGFLREVSGEERYTFVGRELRDRCRAAFDRGIQCILKCQVRIDGRLTVWCAQHDEVTFEPRGARSYELASLSGAESAGILKLLMSLANPSPEVRQAIKGGADWYRTHAVIGLRLERRNGDRVAVAAAGAPLLWARFYDLETGKPFYCDRDGVKKSDYNEVGSERRNGYSWLGTWGQEVEDAYTRWTAGQKP